jgi:hypothetical protein
MGTEWVFLCAAAMTLLWLPLVLIGARRMAGSDAGLAGALEASSRA